MEETTKPKLLVQATMAMEEPTPPTKETPNHLEPRTIPIQVQPQPQPKLPSVPPHPSSEEYTWLVQTNGLHGLEENLFQIGLLLQNQTHLSLTPNSTVPHQSPLSKSVRSIALMESPPSSKRREGSFSFRRR